MSPDYSQYLAEINDKLGFIAAQVTSLMDFVYMLQGMIGGIIYFAGMFFGFLLIKFLFERMVNSWT